MYRHSKQIVESGLALNDAERAIIMLHGRGATPESIINLADHLNTADAAILAPQATNLSWYPYSFMSPVEQNQPALDSALEMVDELVNDIRAKGISNSQIYFVGFSQGACLTLEYVARHAAAYGGVIAYTGGLIGEHLNKENYSGDFVHTPVLITTGDPDPHVPLIRVEESIAVLEQLNAEISFRVYKGRAHTIQHDEILLANKLVLF